MRLEAVGIACGLALLVLAGCTSASHHPLEVTSSTEAAPPVDEDALPPVVVKNRTLGTATDLKALGAPVGVSVPGHRTSEFTVARDPRDPTHLVAAGMD